MVEQKIKKLSFFALLVLIITIFFVGVLVGRSIYNTKLDEIETFIKHNELNMESYIIEQGFLNTFGQYDCNLAKIRINQLSDESVKIGRFLSQDHIQEQIGEEKYAQLKRKYHLMQIRTYSAFKNGAELCNEKLDVVLFFYGVDQESKEQGKILDKLVGDYEITVFAIQFNYSQELNFISDHYEIQATPSLIINFDDRAEGLTDYEELQGYFKSN